MSTTINTNLASLFAQNSLSNAQNNLATSVQRLSSGLRINSAKDDAAGLAIAQNMQSQINGTNQSIQNLNDATNLLQTADSSLSTIQDMLLRMKQLSTQGYDGSLNATQKADIVQQLADLNSEINATAQRTAFNGISLLTSGSSLDLVNTDLKTGVTLSNTQVAVDSSQYSLGYSATNTGSALPVNQQNIGDSALTGSTSTSYSIVLDSSKIGNAPGTYTLTNVGDQLTLTGSYKGQALSQTVTVKAAVGNSQGGQSALQPQSLNFDQFGIRIDMASQMASGKTETGAQLATSLVAKGLDATGTTSTIKVNGKGGVVSDVRLSGTAPGTYTLTYGNTGTISSLGMPNLLQLGIVNNTQFPGALPAAGSTATISGVSLTGGSGTGATANLTYDSTGNVTSIAIAAAGTGYKAGDVLGIAAGGSPLTKPTVATITQGAAGGYPGTVRQSTVSFSAGLSAGQSITIAGRTFSAVNTVTAAQLATAIAGDTSTSNVTVGGTYSVTMGAISLASATSVRFDQAAVGTGTSIALSVPGAGNITGNPGAVSSILSVSEVAGTVAAAGSARAAVDAVTFSNMASGDAVSIKGRVFTAAASLTAAQVAKLFVADYADATTQGTFSGAYTGGAGTIPVLAGAGSSTVNFTDGVAGAGAASILASDITATAGSSAPTYNAMSGIIVKGLNNATGNNTLTMSGTVGGQAVTQSINLVNDPNGNFNLANSVKTLNFSTFGMAFDISSYQNQSANDVGTALASLNPGSNLNGVVGTNTPGQIVVGQGQNSNLQFQSGANSAAFIAINTINVQTGSNGSNTGSSNAMMQVGTDITGTGASGAAITGTLGSLTANDTIANWQQAFKDTASAIDNAIDYISTQRSTFGSQMNRLSYINTNLTAQSTNLQNSRSAITDTNFASETATLTKGQIMQQAATAMLAQANQMPNVILSLLK